LLNESFNLKNLTISTKSSSDFVNITSKVKKIVRNSDTQNGFCLIYCPHTTAGITINEASDPDVKADISKELNKIIPFNDNYAHLEGNSAAHIKATLTGSSAVVPIVNSELILGTWQGIYFCEFDGPRNRTVLIQIAGS